MKLREVLNYSHATDKGDYWFLSDGSICFLCPFCGQINSALNHNIISKNPLTLDPSLVEHDPKGNEKHHFHIINGEIK